MYRRSSSPESELINAQPTCCLDSTCTVKDKDVLWGRTKVAHAHPGNVTFRRLIRQYRSQYQETRIREEKGKVIRTIIAHVVDAGGRFLKCEDENSPSWFEVDPTQTYEKVSHALRSAKAPQPKTNKKKQKKTLTPKVTPVRMTLEEATYENMFAQQTKLLASFKEKCLALQQPQDSQYTLPPPSSSISSIQWLESFQEKCEQDKTTGPQKTLPPTSCSLSSVQLADLEAYMHELTSPVQL